MKRFTTVYAKFILRTIAPLLVLDYTSINNINKYIKQLKISCFEAAAFHLAVSSSFKSEQNCLSPN